MTQLTNRHSPPIDYARDRVKYGFPPELLSVSITLTLALAAIYYWTSYHMWNRWFGVQGYYAHGWMVPLISIGTGYLIVRKHGLPMHSTPESRRLGLAFIIGSLLIHLVSVYALVTFVSGFTLLGVLLGIVLYLGGYPMFSRLWFPIAFLVFMVPLPDVMVGQVNFKLKMFAAAASVKLTNALGVIAEGSGSTIYLADGQTMTVDDVCSGLKSLISLLAFSTLFTYVCKLRGYKRAILFLSAVPIAVAANVVRIVGLVLVAHYLGMDLAKPDSPLHGLMGQFVFVIAFCLMFLEEEFLDILPGARSGTSIFKSDPKAAKEAAR